MWLPGAGGCRFLPAPGCPRPRNGSPLALKICAEAYSPHIRIVNSREDAFRRSGVCPNPDSDDDTAGHSKSALGPAVAGAATFHGTDVTHRVERGHSCAQRRSIAAHEIRCQGRAILIDRPGRTPPDFGRFESSAATRRQRGTGSVVGWRAGASLNLKRALHSAGQTRPGFDISPARGMD